MTFIYSIGDIIGVLVFIAFASLFGLIFLEEKLKDWNKRRRDRKAKGRQQ